MPPLHLDPHHRFSAHNIGSEGVRVVIIPTLHGTPEPKVSIIIGRTANDN